MPGYLTNRYISLDVVNQLNKADSDITALENRVTAAEESIEDLELNSGF